MNQKAAKSPSKPAPTVANGEKKEAATSTTEDNNGVNGTGKHSEKGEDAQEQSSEETATESSGTPKAQTSAQSKRKRIPIKGSTRRKSSSEETGAITGESSKLGGDDIGRTRTSSPPSGVKEQELTGKMSTDMISPSEKGPSKEELDGMLSRTISKQYAANDGSYKE